MLSRGGAYSHGASHAIWVLYEQCGSGRARGIYGSGMGSGYRRVKGVRFSLFSGSVLGRIVGGASANFRRGLFLAKIFRARISCRRR